MNKKRVVSIIATIALLATSILMPVQASAATYNTSLVTDPQTGDLIPDYFGSPNWANSPIIDKFIDPLPELGAANENALGRYIPIASPDTTTYPGCDYYEIAVIEYQEKMHSQLPPTTLRGYVQLSTAVVPGKSVQLKYPDGTSITKSDGTPALAVDNPHYLGPAIISQSNKPVRIKFYNLLPTGTGGDLFIPVDTTIMGAGDGTMTMNGMPMTSSYTQNRADIHLHGNNTVWISDGTPHQWITPAGDKDENGNPIMYPQGVQVTEVPDMVNKDPLHPTNNPTDGTTTLYYTNAQSARLMFYHDHSYGITRLNVYAGEAAPYIIQDQVEKDLINGTNVSGVNPLLQRLLPDAGIPLVIQDKTFVDATTVLNTDPTWHWGTNTYTPGQAYVPTSGDLWYPHVYSPAQNPWSADGANPFGRWMYGPWFYPPTKNIPNGPIANPYYNPDDLVSGPPLMPGVPNPSMPGESFMDTPMVNGAAYPYLEVDPTTYRFRILNAANDRFFNLQIYVANSTVNNTVLDSKGNPIIDNVAQLNNGYPTEVTMIAASSDANIPGYMTQIIPDPVTKGPDWIQIGTEGGFLPTPVVIPSQPISWNLASTAFNFGNVDQHSLLLGPAERADVLVDFSQYAGKTLIIYNDAPAAFPASDTRVDYFTGDPDQTDTGGAPTTLPGKGPNTRTIMQIRVAPATGAVTQYDLTALQNVFEKGAIPATATTAANTGVFATDQHPVIIPTADYNSAYGVTNLPTKTSATSVQIDEYSKTFQPIDKTGALKGEVTLPIQGKALHDEMGAVYDDYGRMSGMLGLEDPASTNLTANFIPFGYASPPVDVISGTTDLETTQIGTASDGTQIWKITHNGVDTHPIHFHLFDVQVINRVAWDGALIPPDPNELGWKETVRVNPLEQCIVAMRPKTPTAAQIPFDIPNSVRLIDPTLPEGTPLMAPPGGWKDPAGNPITQILNHYVNFGWEYVWHCHILSHEEMDMMHAMAFTVPPKSPSNLAGVQSVVGGIRRNTLTWLDNSKGETSFVVQRSTSANGPWTTLVTLAANATSYADLIGNTSNVYYYQILAGNTVGDTATANFPTMTRFAGSNIAVVGSTAVIKPAAPTTLKAVLYTSVPKVVLTWADNAVNETGFVIQRSVNGSAFATLATIGPGSGIGSVTYTDTTVRIGSAYSYRVAATNTAGQSGYSNTAAAIQPTTPSAPTNVAAAASIASNDRYAQISLTWTNSSAYTTGFVIDRATDAAFTKNLYETTVPANVTSYLFASVDRAAKYYIRIRAIGDGGVSSWVSVSPTPVTTP